jgi:Domain of unknown function (DUF4126)
VDRLGHPLVHRGTPSSAASIIYDRRAADATRRPAFEQGTMSRERLTSDGRTHSGRHREWPQCAFPSSAASSRTTGNPPKAICAAPLLSFDPRPAKRNSSESRLIRYKLSFHVGLGAIHRSGVALAAATGFRVFLTMLIASGAAYTGHLHLDDSFAWLGSLSALIMLSVAALVEVLAYTIPVIDNLLDVVSAPAAFIAGTILSAAVMTDMPPMVKWTAAVIAGDGVAGLTRGSIGVLGLTRPF